MKMSAAPIILSVLVFLISCASTQERDAFVSSINEVVETTKSGCSFIPTVASIAAILGVPGAPAAELLSEKICEKVNELPQLESGIEPLSTSVATDMGIVEGILY